MLKLSLDFISSIAWPIVTLFIFISLKKPLSKILEDLKLKNLKYKDLSVDFSDDLNKLEIKLQKSKSKSEDEDLKVEPSTYNNIIEVAKLSPSSSILLSWNLVEEEISAVIRKLSISPDYPAYNSALKNIQLLKEYTNIDDQTVEIIENFRKLRNKSAHSITDSKIISFDDAVQYYFVANSLISRLKKIEYV